MTDPAAPTAEDWTRGTARANGIELHYVAAGPPDGDLVVLLHGFPEFWYSWREQLPALADAGYRAVAPDMRGYNRSERPTRTRDYDLDELVADVAGLIDALGRERAHVVGHDWGGLVAWQVAVDRPEVVDRLAVLNAPHLGRYLRVLPRSAAQLLKSWYVFFFQLPRLPEWSLARNDYAAIEAIFRDEPENDDAFTEADVGRYAAAIARPGALSAAIDYYRALFRRTLRGDVPGVGGTDAAVPAPTLLLWGLRDHALEPSLTEGLDGWVRDLTVDRVPDASHWVHLDAPDRVNERLLTHLAGGGRSNGEGDRRADG